MKTGRDWGDVATSPGCLEHQKLKVAGKDSLYKFQREHGCQPYLGLLTSRTVKE